MDRAVRGNCRAVAQQTAERWLVVMLLCQVLLACGACSSQRFLIRRDEPANPLAARLQMENLSGPVITDRTRQVLRRYAIEELYTEEPESCLERMHELVQVEQDSELVYGVSEVAYVLGVRAERREELGRALDLFGVCVSNAYMYLFSREFDTIRNPYDPLFRGACDLYNSGLEATLRLVSSKGELSPGKSYRVSTGKGEYEVQTVVRGQWSAEDIDHFEFVSDFAVEGLPSSGMTYGLGVPLIAVRKKGSPSDPREAYYPEGLSFPITALLRVVRPGTMADRVIKNRHQCVLEFHDPLAACDVNIAGRLVPLQTDLSTALAYFLDSPQFREQSQATLGLINAEKSQRHRGIYMLEPFDPTRIPVLMVHGLWSSPVTWMPMFNDLRSFSRIRNNYQFWFYQYPTGQPFWLSATQLREDLAGLRQRLDPDDRYEAMRYMVLVGHSMGGLVCRMQTLESGDEFWKILSDRPFDAVQGEPDLKQKLKTAAFFHPDRHIRRVITIGTPHRGSEYANDTTKWVARKLIKLPAKMVTTGQQLVSLNPGVFRNTELLINNTSIDSLSPDSPIFPAMLRASRAPWVKYHNIVGVTSPRTMLFENDEPSDGVVSYASAHMDDVETEVVVPSEHQSIHRHPKAILEVRRILLEHLEAVQGEYRVAVRLASDSASSSENTGFRLPPYPASSSATAGVTPALP
ncbi:MAG: hypothetical protein D6753_02000 [Planctomycetota bacterium]|nr:MAG: hypothetical protein D6753_02000 [Planctomycetota bacterium]